MKPNRINLLIPLRRLAKKVIYLVGGGIAAMLAVAVFVQNVGPFANSSGKVGESTTNTQTLPEHESSANRNIESEVLAMNVAASAAPDEQVTHLRSEHFLPATIDFWISIPDVNTLDSQFEKTQFGQLLASEALKPFVNNAAGEIKNWLVQKNLVFELDLFDETDWISGEACFAYSTQLAPAIPHNFLIRKIMLVDVSGSEGKAQGKLERAFEKLRFRGAKQSVSHFNRVPVIKTKLPAELDGREISYMIYNGWAFVSDHEEILIEILNNKNLKQKRIPKNALARRASFKTTMDRSFIPGVKSNVRWFADPLGLAQLANQVRFNQPDKIKPRNLELELFAKAGFDVFSGIGGNLCLLTGDHELVHREFVCTSVSGDGEKQAAQRRALALFDFDNKNITPIHPPDWISSDVANCLVVNWDFNNALDSFGLVYDTFLESEGEFALLLKDFKNDPDLNLDIEKFVDSLDHRVVTFSHSSTKLGNEETKSAIAYQIKGEEKYVMDSIKTGLGDSVVKTQVHGFDVLAIERNDDHDEFFMLPGETEVEVEKMDPEYYGMAHGYLVVAQDKQVLERILNPAKSEKLAAAKDYKQVYESLEKLTNPQNVSIRQFGRLDSTMAHSYQSLRSGQFELPQNYLVEVVAGWADGLFWTFDFELPSLSEFAWIIARELLFGKRQEIDDPVQQNPTPTNPQQVLQIDGSKLPADFQNVVAPYLGPSGWVLETEQGGWRITGCILKKQE